MSKYIPKIEFMYPRRPYLMPRVQYMKCSESFEEQQALNEIMRSSIANGDVEARLMSLGRGHQLNESFFDGLPEADLDDAKNEFRFNQQTPKNTFTRSAATFLSPKREMENLSVNFNQLTKSEIKKPAERIVSVKKLSSSVSKIPRPIRIAKDLPKKPVKVLQFPSTPKRNTTFRMKHI